MYADLLDHQVEGIQFVKDKLKEHVTKISLSLYNKDGLDQDSTKARTHTVLQDLSEAYGDAGMMLAWEMGLGKAQSCDSKVLTPNGWQSIGSIKVGDRVIGSDGNPTTVAGVFPQGEREIYKVTFSDDSSVECDIEHLWARKSPKMRWRGSKYQVRTLKDLVGSGLRQKNGNRKHFIPMVEPVQFPEKDLLLDPYLLGVLIGEGCLRGRSTKFSTADQEIVDEVNRLLPEGVSVKKQSGYDYAITRDDPRWKRNPVTVTLHLFGLHGHRAETKFIPREYRFASVQQRESLLQGLLDADGHVRPTDNNVEYSTSSPRLAKDVVELVQSLGGTARIRIKKTTHLDAHRMSISLPTGIKPFRLSRKANVYHDREKYLPCRAFDKVEYVGKKDAVCIAVDAEDQLYVTENYIVTHNSAAALRVYHEFRNWIDEWFKEGLVHPHLRRQFDRPALVVCPNTIKGVWWDEYERWTEPHEGKRNLDVIILDSKKGDFETQLAILKAGLADLAIVSYPTVRVRADMGLLDVDWSMVILDEIQAIINSSAMQTQAAYQIKSVFRLGLSGTPFVNKVPSLIGALKMMQGVTVPVHDREGELHHYNRRSKIWGSQKDFESKYAYYTSSGRWRKFLRGQNLEHGGKQNWLRDCRNGDWDDEQEHIDKECMALNPRLKRHLMHRKRTEECIDLPAIRWLDVECELTTKQSEAYEKVLQGVMAWLEATPEFQSAFQISNVMSQMTYAFCCATDLRQLAESIAKKRVTESLSVLDYSGLKEGMFRNLPKNQYSGKLNWMTDALDNDIDGKVVVFTEFATNARCLASDLAQKWNTALLTGSDTAIHKEWGATRVRNRQDLVRQFQEDDDTRIFVTTSAGYEGITLHRAKTAILYGKVSWVPGKVRQAIKRIHRIGQDKPVTIIRLYSPNTIEVWLQQVLGKKQMDFDSAIDGGEVDRSSSFFLGNDGDILDAFKGTIKAH